MGCRCLVCKPRSRLADLFASSFEWENFLRCCRYRRGRCRSGSPTGVSAGRGSKTRRVLVSSAPSRSSPRKRFHAKNYNHNKSTTLDKPERRRSEGTTMTSHIGRSQRRTRSSWIAGAGVAACRTLTVFRDSGTIAL